METCFLSTEIGVPDAWKSSTFKNHSRRFSAPFSVKCCQSGQALPSPQGQDRHSPTGSNWRAFRAKLIAREQAHGFSLSSIPYPDGTTVPSTIGDHWVHTIPEIEKGCLLIGTEKLDGVHVYQRSLILILSTGPIGPTGIILNRPSQITVNEMWQSPLYASPAFSESSLFPGGPMEDVLFLLTPDEKGVKRVDRSGIFTKVMEGLYFGTSESIGCAAEMVRRGEIRVRDLRFFNGYCAWEGTQLREEIRAGLWTVAACSPSIIGLTTGGDGLRQEVLGLLSPQKVW